VLRDVRQHLKQYFKSAGDAILMVRTARPSIAASEYGELFGGAAGPLTPIDLTRERRLVEGLVECAERGCLTSAHDIGQGGLAVALAEACFNPEGVVGAEVEAGVGAEELFGEGASSVILSVPAENIEVIGQLLRPLEVRQIGRVSASPRLKIGVVIDEDVRDLMGLYEDALAGRLGAK
jgi:phosphoribosylformylglycinamidine (FGAM) synthase-like enzyme